MAQEPSLEVLLDGVHAYAEKSLAAGDTIHFRVSSDVPYKLSIVQLGSDVDGTTDDSPLLGLSVEGQARQQPIFPGSYVNVDAPMPALPLQAMTLECWVRPWGEEASPGMVEASASWQGLMSKHSFPDRCGFGLFLTETRQVAVYFGDGGRYDPSRAVSSEESLALRQWHHVVGIWDGQNISLWINGQQAVRPTAIEGPVRPGLAPLRLAAYGQQGITQNYLNGDLAMPVIYSKALSPEEIKARHEDKGLHPPALQGVLACWPLNEEQGSILQDISGNRLHGRIINRATWMIGGPSFDATDASRFTTGYDPTRDATRGHALRFCSLDLYDCGWQVSHSLTLLDDQPPGIYVGRISYGANDEFIYDVTFVVHKARGRPREPLLVICATNSWLAYSGTPFVKNFINRSDPRQRWFPGGSEGGTNAAGLPHQNFYEDCQTGQPTYRMGLNLPWPVAAPYSRYSPIWEGGVCYSHLVRAERFTHRWLEENGYTFDVISDFDLHREPDLLEGYQSVLIAGHSEYWSVPAYEGLRQYLAQGGKVIALSGNTLFWRVSFDGHMTAMECRKYGGVAGARPNATPGEGYHSDDGKLGGLMRQCGHPCWKLLGLESTGAILDYETQASYQGYVCEMPEHPFLADTGLGQGDTFAEGAVGHEGDVCLDTPQMASPDIVDPKLPGLEILASSTSRGPTEDVVWGYDGLNLDPQPEGVPTSQLIHWTRPEGGEVFFAGTIAAGQALHSDTRWATILHNVLASFGVPRADSA